MIGRILLNSLVAAATVTLLLVPQAACCQESGLIRMAVCKQSGDNHNLELIKATVAWLQDHLGSRLAVTTYSVESFFDAVKNGNADFTLSSAGLFRSCDEFGVKDLATGVFREGPDPNRNASAVFVVRRDRADLKTLADLKGKRAAASRPMSIVGLIMGLGEIAAAGYDPDAFFSRISYTGYPMSQVAAKVAEGEADVGFLFSCYYERLVAEKFPGIEELKPFNVKSGGSLQCARSTQAFPGHTVGVTPSARPEDAKLVTQLLLGMPTTADHQFHWGIATNFHSLDEMFRATRYGPYSYLREWTLARVWKEYKTGILLLVACLVFLLGHVIRVNYLVRIRTRMMHAALAAEHRARMESRQKGAQIEALERMGVVQQMSSMLAHELKQPMTAIGYYTDSLLSRIKRNALELETCQRVLEKIASLNRRSSEIVDHVRGYAKKTVSRTWINVADVVTQAVENFRNSDFSDATVRIDLTTPETMWMTADRLELELVVLNLVRNSYDSVKARNDSQGFIKVMLAQEQVEELPSVVITVQDNGPRLADAAFANLSEPFNSTKLGGLGLGLAIVRRIAESYGGRLEFARNGNGDGLISRVRLFATSSDNRGSHELQIQQH